MPPDRPGPPRQTYVCNAHRCPLMRADSSAEGAQRQWVREVRRFNTFGLGLSPASAFCPRQGRPDFRQRSKAYQAARSRVTSS
jgi:hypothetical protein